MPEKRDAVIVGGGPIGCFTAEGLARKGFDADIIEEHWDIGWPMQCAGLLSTRIFDVIGHSGAKRSIQNKVKGARVYSPSGKHIDVMANKTKAYVVDRNILDKELACSAIKSGARLRIGAKAVAAKRTQNGIKMRVLEGDTQSTLESKLLIGADGPQSQVARWFGLKPPPLVFSGFEAELTNVSLPSNRVSIFLSQRLAPGFFAWAIPLDEGTARVGLAAHDPKMNAHQYYERLLKDRTFREAVGWDVFKPPQPIKFLAGGIPLGLVERMYSDNVMLVGDAAGFPKPTSGGGIYTGLVSAKAAAGVGAKALKSGDLSSSMLKDYTRESLKDIGPELKNTFTVRKIYMGMSDKQIEEAFDILADPEIVAYISKQGDIDYPFRLAKGLLAKMPRLFKFVSPFIKGFVFDYK